MPGVAAFGPRRAPVALEEVDGVRDTPDSRFAARRDAPRDRRRLLGLRGGATEPEIRRRVTAGLESLGVADAAWKLPGELSGGMAKRVGIARAMIMAPEILVYDEPTSGLDPVTSRVVEDLIEEVRDRLFVTSVVISQDMATAFRIADRVVLLHRGRIAVDGPPGTAFSSDVAEIQPFARSSGVAPARLSSRAHRKSPADIRALWAERAAATDRRADPAFGELAEPFFALF